MDHDIYISNLPFKADETYIGELFSPFGRVKAVTLHADWVHPRFEPYADVVIETDNPAALVDGNALMKLLGIAPGREVGRLMSLLLREQAAGNVTDRQSAEKFLLIAGKSSN